MTPDETKQAAAVMIAWAEGKRIQLRTRPDYQWIDLEGGPLWNWSQYDYRIAPEPMEVEVWVHPKGMIAERGMCRDSQMASSGYTLRRATIHPETK